MDWMNALTFGLIPGASSGKKKAAPAAGGGLFQSGIRPYDPSQAMTQPPANYWQGNNFVSPGAGQSPMMSSDILARFPELARILGGGQPPMPQTQPSMFDRIKDSGALGSISPGIGLKGLGGIAQKKLFGLLD